MWGYTLSTTSSRRVWLSKLQLVGTERIALFEPGIQTGYSSGYLLKDAFQQIDNNDHDCMDISAP